MGYIEDCGGFYAYIENLKEWCEMRLKHAGKYKQITGLVEIAKNYLNVPRAQAD